MEHLINYSWRKQRSERLKESFERAAGLKGYVGNICVTEGGGIKAGEGVLAEAGREMKVLFVSSAH